MLIDTQAMYCSLTFSYIIYTAQTSVTDVKEIGHGSDTCVRLQCELSRGFPAGPSLSGLTKLLEYCQTCRTGQGYPIVALTLHQGSDRMWTHYILCAE